MVQAERAFAVPTARRGVGWAPTLHMLGTMDEFAIMVHVVVALTRKAKGWRLDDDQGKREEGEE